MIINGERALAYIVTIDEIKPIEGYDRVEYARTSGWWVIVSKEDNLQVGDKCVYFEIDSRVPATDERFAFLAKRDYRIKTQKMCKVISQGLLMPLTHFPELAGCEVGADVTAKLGVTYYIPEDNERKAKTPSQKSKYQSMAARHKKLFQTKPVRWLMKREWGKRFLFFFFGKRHDKPLQFPSYVKKTDEERVENMPFVLGNGKTYVVTEKLDGTSCTYALRQVSARRYDFAVCSRNRRLPQEKRDAYEGGNIYWDLAFKYDIENVLRDLIRVYNCEWVVIQGEGIGSVQGNPLKMDHDDLYVFNLITSEHGRFGSYEGREVLDQYGMKWVPIYGDVTLPDNMEAMKLQADGNSVINPNVLREGLVYRTPDGMESFKNVSREYLLKKK